MEIKGKIIAVQPVQTGEGRNGMWKKQEYVIEYDPTSQYPKKMMFNLWGDKIDQYNIQQGQALKISFDIDCREYQGRWYNDIKAWKIEPDDGATVEIPPAYAPIEPSIAPADESSELPF
ncbi:MAG: DUF3127 domain-containing protein [Tannerella sp.]|jgi:hypothetical protein|nr:DUF3127 domain-containing protein [Tannerella sp.]